MSKKKKTTTNKKDSTSQNNNIVDSSKKREPKEKTTNKKQGKKTVETKNEKKDNKKLMTDPLKNSTNEISKLIKIVLIVTGIMIIFYGITLIATNKADETLAENETEEETETTEIQYENIMIGTMLNYGGTYYVLIENEDDNRLAEYESIITTINTSEDAPTIYKANLTDSFNKNYLGKEQNYYVDNLDDFKVTGTVLVKVTDGEITSVKDSYEGIKNQLNDLI